MQSEWYVIYAAPSAELRTAGRLADRGLEAYCPVTKDWRVNRYTKGKTVVTRPLFSRYLFVGVDTVAGQRADWGRIRATEGVGGFLSHEVGGSTGRPSRAPLRLAGHVVEDIQVAEDMGLFDKTMAPAPGMFVDGAEVRVASGPFEGYAARVSGAVKPGAKKVAVELFFAGNEFPAEIPIDLLRVVA